MPRKKKVTTEQKPVTEKPLDEVAESAQIVQKLQQHLEKAYAYRQLNEKLAYNPAYRVNLALYNPSYRINVALYELLDRCARRIVEDRFSLLAQFANGRWTPPSEPQPTETETHMMGEVQYLERIAETADALESWLGKNVGTNDDWPIEIKADEDGAAKLTRLLRDLNDALTPYRRRVTGLVLLSNCCQKPVGVSSSREGTSCYICKCCGNACDATWVCAGPNAKTTCD